MNVVLSEERKEELEKSLQVFRWKRHVKSTYGIDEKDFDRLLERQNGQCAVCKVKHDESSRKTRLVVDHDHETGKVRGLLCHKCNVGIGLIGDTCESIQRALKYLAGSEVRELPKSAWCFQDSRGKAKLGPERCPWSIGWYDNKRRRRSRVIGSKADAELEARSFRL